MRESKIRWEEPKQILVNPVKLAIEFEVLRASGVSVAFSVFGSG